MLLTFLEIPQILGVGLETVIILIKIGETGIVAVCLQRLQGVVAFII